MDKTKFYIFASKLCEVTQYPMTKALKNLKSLDTSNDVQGFLNLVQYGVV